MNMVPLSPITMVRAPGCPLDQTSALKPAGSLILSIGSLSAEGAIGGVGCGLRLLSCLLSAGLVLSIGLKPGCAAPGPAAANRNARLPATSNPRRYDVEIDMQSSLVRKPFSPSQRTGLPYPGVSDKAPLRAIG